MEKVKDPIGNRSWDHGCEVVARYYLDKGMSVEKVQWLVDMLAKRHRKRFSVDKFIEKERVKGGLVLPTPVRKGVAGKGSGLRNVILRQLSPKEQMNESVEIKTPKASPEGNEIPDAGLPKESSLPPHVRCVIL